MGFYCTKHGEVEPVHVVYTFPAGGDCPICGEHLIDNEDKLIVLSPEEAVKIRPGFESDKE